MSKNSKFNWHTIAFAIALCAAVVGVYSLSLGNGLIFDDERLIDGYVTTRYGSLLELKLRMLSNGSFNWVRSLVGENIPVQRTVNVLLHLCTCCALYQLFERLMGRIAYSQGVLAAPDFEASRRTALQVGIMAYALHPIAVYAVGYLIQRSVVMATLFGVLSCLAFVRAITERKPLWHGVAFFFFVLAALSKEHVVLIAGMAVPLYIFLVRPTWQRATTMVAVAVVLLGISLAILLSLYSGMLGQLFDGSSRELATQLDRQRPGALGEIFALSVVNEAALFFYYGVLWVLPYPGWMSIDMHPPFPLTLTSMPHLLGAFAYCALLIISVIALLRKSDVWGFLGLCLLFPLVLFWTEFSTVWVQDPFVLYRSYLWAIPIPALIGLLLTGFSPGTLYKVAVVLALALGIGTVDRIWSMHNAKSVWEDAIQKTSLPGASNAVGRARPFMNQGAEHLKRFEFELAAKDFGIADALGAIGGEALFSMGMAQRAMGRHAEALQLLTQAKNAGYSGSQLHFQMGEAQAELGMTAEAIDNYTKALALQLGKDQAEQALAHRADAAMRINRFANAKADFESLLKRQPKQSRYLLGLGLAKLGLKDAAGALDTFNVLMTEKPDALAFYGRALAQHNLGNKAAAQEDIAAAVRLDPDNAVYKQVQESIKKGDKLSL